MSVSQSTPQGGQPNIDALFTTEGGVATACDRSFVRADNWNRGTLDKKSAEVAFAQLLMNSEIGRAFQEALDKNARNSPTGMLTQKEFTQLAQEALVKGGAQV